MPYIERFLGKRYFYILPAHLQCDFEPLFVLQICNCQKPLILLRFWLFVFPVRAFELTCPSPYWQNLFSCALLLIANKCWSSSGNRPKHEVMNLLAGDGCMKSPAELSGSSKMLSFQAF
ncbi:hypothetical protein [Caldicellulosiruptor bescii]|uniref:hypothetical protein n=1 Tax=Caldicellulosiruptor bescii TaxID=31899 RepID=UPI0015C4AB95|nr:hypothetical protein [Caldicellulosiruptor bescii]